MRRGHLLGLCTGFTPITTLGGYCLESEYQHSVRKVLKYNNAFSLEEVRRVGNEYGCGTENLSIYRNQYYFDQSGSGSHISYAHNNWSRWIMNSSRGFTRHGIEKIGDSIRAYVYLVLSSQQAARHGIIGDGDQAAAAQEIFVDNLEDVINREVSLEDDIARFQNILKYARSELTIIKTRLKLLY